MGDAINLTPSEVGANSWCHTSRPDPLHHTFVWTIHRFSQRPEGFDQFIRSGDFSFRNQNGDLNTWHLELFPKGRTRDDGRKTGADIYVFLCDLSKISSCEISILRLNQQKQKLMGNLYGGSRHGQLGPWILTSEEAKWLTNDTLTLVCELSVVCDVVRMGSESSRVDESPQVASPECRQQLNLQMENSYRNGDFADVEIHCGTRVFPCHQFMLAARSPVLRAMFHSPMSEAATKKVEIKDLAPDILDAMLLFMYTGEVPNLEERASELLAAAEKYQMDQLKDMCEQELIRTTDCGNALAHLFLGDKYQAAGLRQKAAQIVALNLKAVLANPEWKTQLMSRPAILAELTMELLVKSDSA